MAGHPERPKSPENPARSGGWVSGQMLADVLGISRSSFHAKVRPLALPEEIEKRAGQVFYHAPEILRRYFQQSGGCIYPKCLELYSSSLTES
jgi:hypothetical protein